MCESKFGFKAFWAGFGFRAREYIRMWIWIQEKRVDSDSNPDLRFLVVITPLLFFIWGLAWPSGFESRFGFEAVGFGFKKIGVDSDSAGFGIEVPGFAHHWFGANSDHYQHSKHNLSRNIKGKWYWSLDQL